VPSATRRHRVQSRIFDVKIAPGLLYWGKSEVNRFRQLQAAGRFYLSFALWAAEGGRKVELK
jgi:hypothetical protein